MSDDDKLGIEAVYEAAKILEMPFEIKFMNRRWSEKIYGCRVIFNNKHFTEWGHGCVFNACYEFLKWATATYKDLPGSMPDKKPDFIDLGSGI